MFEWIPDRSALCHDKSCSLDVLVKILAPRAKTPERRPEINLALVIDKSGSMAGLKIGLTRLAANLVVNSLSAQDYLSIVLFGDTVEVLLASTRLTDKAAVLKTIEGIAAAGSTALFQGWKSGAAQACLNLDQPRLHRVVLLTDGQANVGETNPDRICDEVHRICGQGVQTTTLGFGRDYNEVLLRSIAASGEGNHFFVQNPDQLSKFFELELDGLAATLGTRVRLRLKPLLEGIAIEELGEVQKTAEGAYQLADLTADCPLEQLFRITVPAASSDTPCITAELSWNSPRTGAMETLEVPLQLPRMTMAERLDLPSNPEVEKHLLSAMAARSRREAMAALNRNDRPAAAAILQQALSVEKLPDLEKSQLEHLKRTVDQGDNSTSSKLATAQSYSYSRGSISLNSLDVEFVQGLIHTGVLLLRWNGLLTEKPGGPRYLTRPWSRMEGALGGLFHGEASGLAQGAARGEASQLVLASLPFMEGQTRLLLPVMTPLVRRLSEATIESPSASYLGFRSNVEKDVSFVQSGVPIPDCGAVRRIAPLLLARFNNPAPRMWTLIVMASHATHCDAASTACCVAFSALLWDLMACASPPAPHFYVENFVATLREVETETPYPSRAPRYDGWSGKMSQFLDQLIPDARKRGLSAVQAHQEWGSSSYLFESIPTLLYILENHGHQPQEALRQAILETSDPAALGALVGAAVGALHGPLSFAPPDAELTTALERVAEHLK